MDSVWRHKLREVRLRIGISQREVAERTGLSPESVRAYETGRRRPTRERLAAILQALEATAYEANEILEAAGMVTPATLFPGDEYPNYFFSVDELQAEVELVEWPEFVLNNANEVVAANSAVQALWGIDFARERETRTRAQLNLLSVASQRKFADRIVNWDQCIATLAAVFKGRPVNPASLDEPDPYFSEVLQEFADGDPAFLARLVQVWVATPGRDAKVRWSYRIVWRDDEFGEMRFRSVVGTASEPGGLSFNDWQPLDAETWNVLERVKARAILPASR
ncbi:MAG: helix-turn-helix transcriptional regulator [Chloroflexota bacterium]|nr:helix-turn-helix transcriptional regulator [Chloroflexota bacterium]